MSRSSQSVRREWTSCTSTTTNTAPPCSRWSDSTRRVLRSASPAAASGVSSSTRRTLYRLPAVIAAVEAGKTIYVVEGEKDVDAMVAAGHAADLHTARAPGSGTRSPTPQLYSLAPSSPSWPTKTKPDVPTHDKLHGHWRPAPPRSPSSKLRSARTQRTTSAPAERSRTSQPRAARWRGHRGLWIPAEPHCAKRHRTAVRRALAPPRRLIPSGSLVRHQPMRCRRHEPTTASPPTHRPPRSQRGSRHFTPETRL